MKEKLRKAGLGWCESDEKAVVEKLGTLRIPCTCMLNCRHIIMN